MQIKAKLPNVESTLYVKKIQDRIHCVLDGFQNEFGAENAERDSYHHVSIPLRPYHGCLHNRFREQKIRFKHLVTTESQHSQLMSPTERCALVFSIDLTLLKRFSAAPFQPIHIEIVSTRFSFFDS